MKRVLGVCLLALMMTATVADCTAQGISRNGLKVEFTFPEAITSNAKTLFPTYEAQAEDYAATVSITANDFYTYLSVDTLTGNTVINVTAASWLTAGALLYVETIADDQRSVSWNTGVDAPVFTTDSLKHELTTFVFTGSTFKKIGTAILD